MMRQDNLSKVANLLAKNGHSSTGRLGKRRLDGESDTALAIRARADRAAFGELYERYVKRIHSYHYYRCSSQSDAEDLTARTFLQALANIHRYSDRGAPFSAWLFRIAHNLVANWHRDNARRPVWRLDGMLQLAGGSADPVEAVEAADAAEEVRTLVGKLAADRQQLIILKFASRMSNAEVAVVMGRTEGAIKALLHRTITSLRVEFASLDNR